MTQASLSPLDHHMLGLLVDGPRHGYEIIEHLEQRAWCDEVARLGSVAVYQTLAALEKRGWVVLLREQAGTGKLRTVYEISQAGQNALWLASEQALREFPTTPEFLRGLAYAHVLSEGILRSRLEASHDEVMRRLGLYEHAPADDVEPRGSLLAHERELLLLTAKWIEALLVPAEESAEEEVSQAEEGVQGNK